MLDTTTKKKIDDLRDILVGKIPDPKSQVEQITIALIYKFMDDMDAEAEELGGKRKFFSAEFERYGWKKLLDPSLGGHEVLNLYAEALQKMNINANVPQLFRDIFKNAYLPYRDPETLKSFLKIIDDFNYDHSEKLGDAFEYLLSVLGSQGDAGQFRTPRHIIDFMVYLVDPKKDETILDPACGTAGFLISSYKQIIKTNSGNYDEGADEDLTFGNGNGVRFTGDKLTPDERKRLAENIQGYDISPDMVRLSLVNLYLHGFTNPKIVEYDSLTSEERWKEHADVILANPPFMSPKGGIKPHKRFSVESRRSEVLFVDYIAEHLTPNGRAAVIVPEGIIFQSGKAYKELRKMLVENYLYAVVSLPAGVFNPYSGVKTSILLMDKSLAKRTNNLLFVKIENDGFDLGAQRRPNNNSELPAIAKAIKDYINCLNNGKEFDTNIYNNTIIATKGKIGENGEWNLSGERYSIRKNIIFGFPSAAISELCEFNNGLWKGEKEPLIDVSIIRNTNFSKNGFIDWSDIAIHPVEVKQLETRKLRFGDIIVEKSGGGPTQPVGRVVIFDKKEGIYSYSNFTSRIRVINDKVIPKYLWLVLRYFYQIGGTDKLQNQTSGIRNLDFKLYQQIQIPLPPLEIQKEIVAEIEGWQKIIDGARQVVENYKPQIEIDPSWPMVELGEVCDINPKKSELSELSMNTEVSFVPMAEINENEIYFNSTQTKQINEVYSGYTYFRDNDVLLAKVTPCFENGKAGIALNLKNGIGFGSSELFVLRASHKTKPHWIYYNIITHTFRENGKLRMTGTGGLQRVPKDFLSNYKIPLPSIEIQERLINDIEEEIKIVQTNKNLIAIFEQKIKNKISKIWGE
jgi:type I restriction enzyme M protein